MTSAAAARRGVRLLLVLGWTTWLVPPLGAGASPRPLWGSLDALAPRVSLAAVRPSELVPGASAYELHVESLGSSSYFVDRRLAAPAGRMPAPLPLVVRRELPELWQMRLPADVDLDRLDVSYQVISARGQEDRLSLADGDSEVRVRLRPLPLVIVDHLDDEIVVQGGIVLEIDLSSARAAGTYSGTIVATVLYL